MLKSEILDCSVREKGTVPQRFFGIFEFLKHCFLSKHFQNVSVVQSGSRLHTLFVQLCKLKLRYICFSHNVPKFSVQLFQSNIMKSSLMGFSRVLGFRL